MTKCSSLFGERVSDKYKISLKILALCLSKVVLTFKNVIYFQTNTSAYFYVLQQGVRTI
jgi:hypothetical protein